MHYATHSHIRCEVHLHRYKATGHVAIQLVVADDYPEKDIHKGEPWATATVCLPDAPLAPDEVIIKNYNENAGMAHALVDAGIIERAHRHIDSGFVPIPVCKLLVQPSEEVTQL
jgi:hypothetical protein